MKVCAGNLILKRQQLCRDSFYDIEVFIPAEVPVLDMDGLWVSPLSVNELGRIFCYASIICMDCLYDKSHIGAWQRFYDCRITLSDIDVL